MELKTWASGKHEITKDNKDFKAAKKQFDTRLTIPSHLENTIPNILNSSSTSAKDKANAIVNAISTNAADKTANDVQILFEHLIRASAALKCFHEIHG